MLDQDFLYNQVCLFQKTVSSLKFNLKTKLNSAHFSEWYIGEELFSFRSLSVLLHQGEFCFYEKHAVSDWKVKQEYSVPFLIPQNVIKHVF